MSGSDARIRSLERESSRAWDRFYELQGKQMILQKKINDAIKKAQKIDDEIRRRKGMVVMVRDDV